MGRSSEMSVLTHLIDMMTATGQAVIIAGEAGIGKTMLAEAAARADHRSPPPPRRGECGFRGCRGAGLGGAGGR
nr:ATP-binding protein [Frankia canadensis]